MSQVAELNEKLSNFIYKESIKMLRELDGILFEVYKYLVSYYVEHGHSPKYEEWGQAVGLSIEGVSLKIKELQKLGYVEILPNQRYYKVKPILHDFKMKLNIASQVKEQLEVYRKMMEEGKDLSKEEFEKIRKKLLGLE